MSNDAGGYPPPDPPPGPPPAGPPPAYPAPGYGPPAYGAPGYGPPAYGTPGYGPPGSYPPAGPPPGYPPGYPPGWGAPPPIPVNPMAPMRQTALKPGVIPLRPLTLSDIFNGAVAYIRTNPKATLGLTAIVVVVAQLLALVLQIGSLAATGDLVSSVRGDDVSTVGLSWADLASVTTAVANTLALLVLSGMLTVVIGRAVFGAGITISEAWERLRGRLWALIGFSVLELLAVVVIVVLAVVMGAALAAAGGAGAGALIVLLFLGTVALLAYLATVLSFGPPVIVLERLGVFAAIARSFGLVRNSFWRVFGIRLLAWLVAGVISVAVAVPFSVAGGLFGLGADSSALAIISLTLIAIGGAVGQIITTPFNAGVIVLLYADRRIRAEAFDLVLQTGATAGPAHAESTDQLWLPRPTTPWAAHHPR